MTFGLFSKVRSFETDFSFKKTQISQFDIMKYSSFLNLVFRQRHFNCRKLIVFSCLQFADCYIWPRILSCGVIFVLLITSTESFPWKVSLEKSWCCRKHVFVFEIVSLKKVWIGLIKLSFPCEFWVKDFVHRYGKKFEKCSILGVDFLFVLES